MSDKQKKFDPSTGLKVTVHFNMIAVRAVAQELNTFPETLAEALDRAGFMLTPDPFNISSDTGKLIILQERKNAEGLRVVKEETNE